MKTWKNFNYKKPIVGQFIIALGFHSEDPIRDWLFWGYYDPSKPEGTPPKNACYWISVPPFPALSYIQEDNKSDG